MNVMSKRTKNRRTARSRGSALLMSLVIMVGLSLLGLGFVAISETESAISVNERHAAQTQAVAETGAKAVVEYFQDPQWARSENFTPANADTLISAGGFKRQRTVGTYTGVYKPAGTSVLLLDRPFRPQEQNRFYGEDATADLEFNRTNAATQLTNINTALFGADSRANGRIEEIKVYAPPIIGGTLNGQGFWEGGTRYGYATIKVTAEKWSKDNGGGLLSRRVVRLIVGEFPMPVPGGPVQSEATVAFGGTADVHWGDVTSFGDLSAGGASLPDTTFPWANPYDRPAFENEYDPGSFPGGSQLLREVLRKEYEDPWFGTRSRGNNENCDPNCGTYAPSVQETDLIYSSFENQTSNTYPSSKLVTFPDIRYDIWKKIATASRGMKGIYYFTYDPGTSATCAVAPCFRKNGQGADRSFGHWVNTLGGARLGAGLYFFDTTDGQYPRPTGVTANLTPAVDINSAAIATPFRMEGFIYLNATGYGSSGIGSCCPAAGFNMPAEIFRDIGYRPVDAGGNFLVSGSEPVWRGVSNGIWDFQDFNNNGRFDLVLSAANTTMTPTDTPPTDPSDLADSRTVVPWTGPTCSVATCSEPHEPYINFIYPAMGSPTGIVTAAWEVPGDETRRPKKRGVTQADCDADPNSVAGDDNCTSNKYDGPRSNNANDSGAIVNLTVLLDGILFNEGGYSSTGNADYYGALLFRGAATGSGTPVIWFNERLLKGEPPPNFPRVMIYSMETDPVS